MRELSSAMEVMQEMQKTFLDRGKRPDEDITDALDQYKVQVKRARELITTADDMLKIKKRKLPTDLQEATAEPAGEAEPAAAAQCE